MTDVEAKYDTLKKIVKNIGRGFFLADVQLDVRTFGYINLSYSSSGEDLWLRQFLKKRLRSAQPGFYVDIGANDPIGTSNTYLFYTYGWRGVCIDANPRFRAQFETYRPRDILVNAAVSDLGQSLYFAEAYGNAGHKIARVMSDPKQFTDQYQPPVEVKSQTLAKILDAHVPEGTEIDFMSIDLEDSELPALRSNNWSRYMARVILIECGTGFDPLEPLKFPTLNFLHSLGYKYQGFSCNNVLMTSPHF